MIETFGVVICFELACVNKATVASFSDYTLRRVFIMKLRTFLILFILTFVTLTLVNDYITVGLSKLNQENEKSESDMLKTVSVAQDLLVANQYTTRFSRAYVNTGDKNRRDFYQDILDILDGKITPPKNYSDDYWDRVVGGLTDPPEKSKSGAMPIENIFLNLNVSNAEFSKLQEAKMKIFELSKTELHAMDIAKEYYDNKQQNIQTKLPKLEIQTAVNLLHDKDYNVKNAEIAQLLSEFKSMIQERYAKKMGSIHQRYNNLLHLNAILSICLYSVIFLSSLYLYFRIEKRGIDAIRTLQIISDGDLSARTKVSGNDEIGRLASLVNWTGSNLQTKVDELEDRVKKTESLMQELTREKDRSEKLLHNILPAAIAQRLANGEDSIAEVFPEVTVMFSDIVGFTELSEKIGPIETVNLLNFLFGKFDELAEKHGVEKIKTIGDCYMVVGGVPNRDPLHCQHIAAFAMDARNCIENLSYETQNKIQLRMGIHTGTVAAGIVGKKRFSYDLWGDVVNIASRFESTAEPNKIHVSEAVKFRLSDDFLFLDGGELKLKGKGTIRSFYLLGRKESMPEILEFKKT